MKLEARFHCLANRGSNDLGKLELRRQLRKMMSSHCSTCSPWPEPRAAFRLHCDNLLVMMGRSSGRIGIFARPERIDPNPPTEADLVRGIADGERWAADALYDLLYPTVARSLQRVLHDAGPDYEDLVQTTFERIVRSLIENLGESVLSLRAWASGVASHVALDALRSKARERRLFRSGETEMPGSVDIAVVPAGERQVDARCQLAVVRAVLADMKPALAETVVLHDLIGHDLAEIAVLTRVSSAAAQSRLVRGRKELLRRVQRRLDRGDQ
jgi:RNA polymerase sigma factor (sigma-70 family)